jgi:uncharacterized protein YqfB (UPF0267 family)
MYATTQVRHPKVRDRTRDWMPPQEPPKDCLFNEVSFYTAFTKDVLAAKREVIIYSPFVSKYRAETVFGAVAKLTNRNIDVFIFTRPVAEYEARQRDQVRSVLAHFEELGAFVYCLPGGIHEKIAIIDREILWEGSLNILSQRSSREMMRRSVNETLAIQVLGYLRLQGKLADGYKQKYERLYRGLMEGAQQYPKIRVKAFILGLIVLPVVGIALIAILNTDLNLESSVLHLIEVIKMHTPK